MRTNQRGLIRWDAVIFTLGMLALMLGTATAEVPSTTAYHFSSHPMISGTVVTVNDRQMVVDTDQGERVTLEMDSRTMAPRDLSPGMVLRVDFLALEDCRFYAQRITPVRSGMSTSRLQAYANTREGPAGMARNASTSAGDARKHEESAARIDGRIQPRIVGEPSPGAIMSATPSTADHGFSAHPMVSGQVISVNDHRLVVRTDQGQQVGMVMDSRTMVPREVAPGAILRAEFMQMKDGRYYAKRVSRIGAGVADREQAYAHTRDSDLVSATNASDCGFVSAGTGNAATSSLERRVPAEGSSPLAAQSVPAPVVERPSTLPQTASHQPLLLLFGLLSMGAGGLVTVLRGLRIV